MERGRSTSKLPTILANYTVCAEETKLFSDPLVLALNGAILYPISPDGGKGVKGIVIFDLHQLPVGVEYMTEGDVLVKRVSETELLLAGNQSTQITTTPDSFHQVGEKVVQIRKKEVEAQVKQAFRASSFSSFSPSHHPHSAPHPLTSSGSYSSIVRKSALKRRDSLRKSRSVVWVDDPKAKEIKEKETRRLEEVKKMEEQKAREEEERRMKIIGEEEARKKEEEEKERKKEEERRKEEKIRSEEETKKKIQKEEERKEEERKEEEKKEEETKKDEEKKRVELQETKKIDEKETISIDPEEVQKKEESDANGTQTKKGKLTAEEYLEKLKRKAGRDSTRQKKEIKDQIRKWRTDREEGLEVFENDGHEDQTSFPSYTATQENFEY